MEPKILLNYETYNDLLNYKKLYEKLITEKEEKNHPQIVQKGDGFCDEETLNVQDSDSCPKSQDDYNDLFKNFLDFIKNDLPQKANSEHNIIKPEYNRDLFENKFHNRIKKRAIKLLNELQNIPDFQINQRGEIIIDNKIIANSDIAKLIKFAITGFPNKHLTGKTEFTNFLIFKLSSTSGLKGIKVTQETEKEKTADLKQEIEKKASDNKWYCLNLTNVWK